MYRLNVIGRPHAFMRIICSLGAYYVKWTVLYSNRVDTLCYCTSVGFFFYICTLLFIFLSTFTFYFTAFFVCLFPQSVMLNHRLRSRITGYVRCECKQVLFSCSTFHFPHSGSDIKQNGPDYVSYRPEISHNQKEKCNALARHMQK